MKYVGTDTVYEPGTQPTVIKKFMILLFKLSYMYTYYIQSASGIDARFLKLSPASAVNPIMTKFSQLPPTPPAT
jgi:hypothetical protein